LVSLERTKRYKFSSLSKESEIEPALSGSPSLALSLRSKPGRGGYQEEARRKLSLPPDKKIIFVFGQKWRNMRRKTHLRK